jgi:hypothetical protein
MTKQRMLLTLRSVCVYTSMLFDNGSKVNVLRRRHCQPKPRRERRRVAPRDGTSMHARPVRHLHRARAAVIFLAWRTCAVDGDVQSLVRVYVGPHPISPRLRPDHTPRLAYVTCARERYARSCACYKETWCLRAAAARAAGGTAR